jgi:hypothetical protein
MPGERQNHSRIEGDVDLDELAEQRARLDSTQDFPTGLERLFAGPSRLRSRDEIIETEIVYAGNFNLSSGFVSGDDPGNWQWGAAVFEMKVPAGTYPVELVAQKSMGVIGAARIVFNRSTEVATRAYARRKDNQKIPKADTYYKNSYVIGIDGGVLGLADARDVSALTVRQREDFYHRMVEVSGRERAKRYWFVSLYADRMALVISTGYGDGGYPAYWLLDADGRPVSLVFDFVDLGEPTYEIVKLALANQLLQGEVLAPELAARHMSVAFTHESDAIILDITADGVTAAALFDGAGNLIASSDSSGSRHFGQTRGYYLPKTLPKRLSGHLEIQIYLGHRYHFVSETEKS